MPLYVTDCPGKVTCAELLRLTLKSGVNVPEIGISHTPRPYVDARNSVSVLEALKIATLVTATLGSVPWPVAGPTSVQSVALPERVDAENTPMSVPT